MTDKKLIALGVREELVETFEGVDIYLQQNGDVFTYYGEASFPIDLVMGERLEQRVAQLTAQHVADDGKPVGNDLDLKSILEMGRIRDGRE